MGDSGLICCSFSHHLLFSSLPLSKSCKTRLEEFRCRDPSFEVSQQWYQSQGAADHLQGGGRLQPRPPCKGVADYGQAPYKGRPPVVATAPRARTATTNPQGAAASGQAARACCPRRDRKGQPPTVRPQVAAARWRPGRGQGRKGQLRGQGCRLQGRPLAGAAASPRGAARRQQLLSLGRLPTPTACSVATCAGQRRRRR
ncbi:hypothetical protein BHE74_00040779 [Ensete ventricosum]|nr:hypothetical protein BHE74_00040779 [Ensete ventricosum]